MWHVVYEDAAPMWVHDLDTHTYGLDHRRLCVWQEESDGTWHWELETYTDLGRLASGASIDREGAMAAALAFIGSAA